MPIKGRIRKMYPIFDDSRLLVDTFVIISISQCRHDAPSPESIPIIKAKMNMNVVSGMLFLRHSDPLVSRDCIRRFKFRNGSLAIDETLHAYLTFHISLMF